MQDRKRKVKAARLHNKSRKGHGFTISELCVVMAIVAIVASMIVSFTVLMKEYAVSNETGYAFLEDCSEIKDELYKWVAENDTPDFEASADEDGERLIFEKNGESLTASFESGTLHLGGKSLKKLKAVKNIQFAVSGRLVKCTVTREGEGEKEEKVFVFARRCALEKAESEVGNE